MRPSDYDYELPKAQIAQRPAARRSEARLMVVTRPGAPAHARIAELPDCLEPGALLVLNDSRVVPARLHARRSSDGRVFELLLCEPADTSAETGHAGAPLRAWVRGAKRLAPGDRLEVGSGEQRAEFVFEGPDALDPRARCFRHQGGPLLELLEREGEIPLPPYIAREHGADEDDRARYQSVLAEHPGSVAAPTASLHFDHALLSAFETARVTLHVGPGTFLPMEADDVREHRVGSERFEISEASAETIAHARAQGRPVVAVGTTVTRALEAVALAHGGRVVAARGRTDLVISPGHRFAVVDQLLTNFHLPRSSLLMLACTFGGRRRVLDAYAEAVRCGYRFYSYGDCMLLSRAPDPA